MTHLIISTEYHMNTPSVFALIEGEYFGCKIYPTHRNFPTSFEYWQDATGSDSDRYFSVSEISVDNLTLELIKKLQIVVDANESMIERKSYSYIKKEWKIKRGAIYQAWKIANDAQSAQIKEESNRNAPFEQARSVAYRQLRNLLLSLKK